MLRLALVAAVAFILPGCAANLVTRPSTTIVVTNGAGFLLHTTQNSPYQTTGDTFTASEDGYTGSFAAHVQIWNHKLAPSPCYSVTPTGSASFSVTEGGVLCVAGDVEAIAFSDSTGKATLLYLTP